MNKFIALLLIGALMIASSVSAAVDTDFMTGLADTHYKQIESVSVGRSYHIFVMLPVGYEQSGDKDYPTIYLLDGGGLFPLLSAYSRYLNFGEEIPDTIIVGISYGSVDYGNGNYRSTDYTASSPERDYYGGAGKFQMFLADELIPYIEKTYRTDAARRVIFGQSIGGQFVLYTALTRPNLFWGHVASNPALHRNLPFFLENHSNNVATGTRSKVFVGDGTLNDARFRVPSQKWIEHWLGRDDKPWELETMDLEGHSHMSAPPASFREGLRWMFGTND